MFPYVFLNYSENSNYWEFCSNLPVKFAIFLKVAYFLTPKRDLGRFSVWKRLK